jgi:DmsE family decaheme c-type cytochrome
MRERWSGMKTMIRRLGFGALLMVLGVGLAAAQAANDDREASEACAVCHDTVAAELEMTVHSPMRAGTPSCVTCHGDGTKHMDNDGDPSMINIPTGASGAATCLECHGQIQQMFAGRWAHGDAEVYCGSCHTIHSPHNAQPMQLVKAANDLCAQCHPSQAGSFEKPFGHDLDLGGVQCISCHDPHGGGGGSLKVDSSGEIVCYSCHAEKRGPFVFPHVNGVAGTCLSCHQPHGSVNPMALTRSRVDQLCLECHSVFDGSTLGSQPPSFHNLRSPRYQNCTTCHVAVHGSNTSPLLEK